MSTCAVCGHPFRAKRRDARTCSDRCRKAASRARQGAVTDPAAPSPEPSVTRHAAPAPQALVGFGVCPAPAGAPACGWCAMTITEAELDPGTGRPFTLAGQPHHRECARSVAAQVEAAA